MADVQFVLCNPLCYLTCKFGKTQAKLLKTSLLDFYNPDVLSAAKLQLISDSQKVKSTISLPHIPKQRQGDNRAARDVDDIFILLTNLDENALLSVLPTYVSDGPDNMPSTRLYEGDLGVLMSLLDKMDNRMQLLESAITGVARDVYTLRSKFAPPESGIHQSIPDINKTRTCEPAAAQSADQTAGSSQACKTTSEVIVEVAKYSGQQVNDWASLASTPVQHNRYSVLATTDDDHSDDAGTFVEPRSARIKRRRQISAQQKQEQKKEQQQQRVAGVDQQQSSSARRLRAPLVIGKSTTSDTCVAAAKKIFKKSVFCIDNVCTSHTTEDIEAFVSGMGVDVVTCFEAKPRRRRQEQQADDRKAFRLCIRADDRERLLDASFWPDSITISEWFFKPPQSDGAKKGRFEEEGGASVHPRSTDETIAYNVEEDNAMQLEVTLCNLNTNHGGSTEQVNPIVV